MVQLPEDPESLESRRPLEVFTRIVNSVRIHNVPALNLCIVAVLASFLLKLTTKYRELYMKNSLITIIVTNLVLYGISETLAQTILSFSSAAPLVSFTIRDVFRPASALPETPRHSVAQNRETVSDSLEDPGSDDSEVDEENFDRFLHFLSRSDSSLPYQPLSEPNVTQTPPRPSYFRFDRLAGFMCWGFIMAFVQCWWYKFLQIYSKHPQFVEVLRKVMSDQFCFSPISLFCFFTYGTMVLESGTWEDTKQKLHKLYLQTLIINYCVWFPVQFINFLLVPRELQVPFSSSISVLWNCFLSMRNSTS